MHRRRFKAPFAVASPVASLPIGDRATRRISRRRWGRKRRLHIEQHGDVRVRGVRFARRASQETETICI
eukprot:11202571-Lingulodinium_polyedra.AAC.1